MHNQQDTDYATRLHAELGEKNIISSMGSVGFVASMEVNSGESSSGITTEYEVATREDVAELQR